MKRGIFIVVLLFLSFLAEGQSLKRMLKSLEKQDFEQLEGLLLKRYEKDTLNPDTYYVNALLFLEDAYPKNDLDSAYHYIITSAEDWDSIEEKEKERLEKNGLSRKVIDNRVEQVESMGFDRAQELNTVEDYQYFIDYFQGAIQTEEAISKRNDLAFQIAKSINTYESYSYFLSTYPEARQVSEAKELYDIRLFQEKTKEGTLNSYKSFIVEHPDSPFRIQAEKQAFEVMTAPNQSQNYIDFLNQVDHQYFSKKAADYLYYTIDRPANWLNEITDAEIRDSLQNVEYLEAPFLIPFYDISAYGFMNESGETLIKKSFQQINVEYICEGLEDDFIVFINENGTTGVSGRNGQQVMFSFEGEVTDHGYGILESNLEENSILFHKGGYHILTGSWDEILILAGAILAIQSEGTWKLYSFSGRKLTDEAYEDVDQLHQLILIKKDETWAISYKNQMTGGGRGVAPSPRFEYDDVEVEDDHILAFKDDKMYLLDSLGFKLLDRGYDDVSLRFNRWIFSSDSIYEVAFDAGYGSIGPFSEVIYNEKFILGMRRDRWSFISEEDTLAFNLSQPRFFGTEFLIADRSDSLMLFYHPDSIPVFIGDDLPELLSHTGYDLNEDRIEYVLLEKRNNRILISSTGRTIELGNRYESFQLQGNRYIIYEDRKGKKGVLNLKGKMILRPRYEGIGNYKNGFVALLQGGKFGLFGGENEILIDPEYDKAPEVLTNTLFIARKDGQFGLIDGEEKVILDFEYDDIQYWNDSVCWLKKDFRWSLQNITTKEILLEDVKDFKPLQAGDENLYKILTGTGYGIISSTRGIIVPPTYSDLRYFLNQNRYTYFCEKHIEEAQFYVLIYVDHNGNIIKKQAFEEDSYEMIYCEED